MLVLRDNGQAMFAAQFVGTGADLRIVAVPVEMLLLSRPGTDGIVKDMVVDVSLVDVRPDNHLVVRQVFLRELFRNLQSQFRRDLSRLEGLDDVVGKPTARLAEFPLGVHHLLILPAGVAVKAGGQNLPVRLVSVQDIPDGGVQSRAFRVDLRYRHYLLPIRYISA